MQRAHENGAGDEHTAHTGICAGKGIDGRGGGEFERAPRKFRGGEFEFRGGEEKGGDFSALPLGFKQKTYNKQMQWRENIGRQRLRLEEGLEGSLVGASGVAEGGATSSGSGRLIRTLL